MVREFEVGKYYGMTADRFYTVLGLPRRVMFDGIVVIQLNSIYDGKPVFGYLVNISSNQNEPDTITNIEIEVPEDSLFDEYIMKDGKITCFPDFKSWEERNNWKEKEDR